MTRQTETHSTIRQQRIVHAVAVLMLCVVATVATACGDVENPPTSNLDTQVVATDAKQQRSVSVTASVPSATATPKVEEPAADTKEASMEEAKSTEDKDEEGEHASASSESSKEFEGDNRGGGDDDDAVSNSNRISGSSDFDWAQNQALRDAESLEAVSWTSGPAMSPGELSGEGKLDGDAVLFDPNLGEGAAFAVYHANYDDEPMLVLLPNLGAMMIWDTSLTVAEMDYELEGESFSFRAYSPMLFDADPSDLKLRVFGFDSDGAPALLAVSTITFE